MSSVEKKSLFQAFKKLLKEQNLTYQDLAQKTGVSESTIKRTLSLEDCSVSRLIEMLTVVGLSLTELVEFSNRQKLETEVFTLETEEFFSTSIDYFFFYRKLWHHKDINKLKLCNDYSHKKITKYLRKLDDLALIKWHPDDRIQFLNPMFLKFREDGPLKTAAYKAWAPILHHSATNQFGQEGHRLRIFSAMCTAQLSESFYREFEGMIERYAKMASLEGKTQPHAVNPWAVSLAVAPLRFGLDPKDVG